MDSSSSQGSSKQNMSSQENLKQSVLEQSTEEKFKSKDGAMECINHILEKKDPEDFLQSIDHGEFLVLFKDGDELDKTVLELLSCN